jgi:predicted secreted protein
MTPTNITSDIIKKLDALAEYWGHKKTALTAQMDACKGMEEYYRMTDFLYTANAWRQCYQQAEANYWRASMNECIAHELAATHAENDAQKATWHAAFTLAEKGLANAKAIIAHTPPVPLP